jgi:hypothetical protein
MMNEAMRALTDAQNTLRRSLSIPLLTLPASFADDHCVNELNLPASSDQVRIPRGLPNPLSFFCSRVMICVAHLAVKD